MQRRDFLKSASTAAGAALLSQTSIFSMAYTNLTAPTEVVQGMPRRALGATGRTVSLVGFPGLALVHDDYTQERCNEAVESAFRQGVNYFDVAPAYGDGKCEERLGIALQAVDRKQLFLACKTKQRDRDGARREMDRSFELLKTDYFDLYQLHHVRTVDEARQALGPGGAMEVILEAQRDGRVGLIGFSAHTTLGALELMNGFRFDTVMFPINFVELYNRNFGKEIIDLANQQGASLISIKTMSYGGWPDPGQRTRDWWYRSVETEADVRLAWQFALSRKGVAAGIPPSFLDLVERAIAAARDYQPPSEHELRRLQEMAAGKSSIFEREENRYAPRAVAAAADPRETSADLLNYYDHA